MIYEYDASLDKCPVPIVNMRLVLKKMKKKDTLILKINDAGSIEDIPKLLTKLGYHYNQSIIDKNILEFTIHAK